MQLTLIIPVYNEEDALPLLRQAITEWKQSVPFTVEILLVNDGSRDSSLALLRSWAESDKNIKVLSFCRNFGHQAALIAGLDHAQGDAVVMLDADLQDPLEVIPTMVAQYEAGYDMVYGRRIERHGESWFKRTTAWLFYRLMQKLVHDDLPLDAGDFRLVSRRCVKTICGLQERDPFVRGLFAWTGYPQIHVDYVRNSRSKGVTKYPFWKMCRFAFNAALSFSLLPIRFIGIFGLILAGGSFAAGFYAALRWLVAGDTVQGWPTIVVLVAFIGGTNLIGLSVIGEYVGRVHEAVKQRPRYIIGATINIEVNQ